MTLKRVWRCAAPPPPLARDAPAPRRDLSVGWVEPPGRANARPMAEPIDKVMGFAALYPSYAQRSAALHDPRGNLATQSLQAEQGVGAGFRDLDALGRKVLAEETEMSLTLGELLRRQHRREHRHLRSQLHIHQRFDHGVGDEFMAVDARIADARVR